MRNSTLIDLYLIKIEIKYSWWSEISSNLFNPYNFVKIIYFFSCAYTVIFSMSWGYMKQCNKRKPQTLPNIIWKYIVKPLLTSILANFCWLGRQRIVHEPCVLLIYWFLHGYPCPALYIQLLATTGTRPVEPRPGPQHKIQHLQCIMWFINVVS